MSKLKKAQVAKTIAFLSSQLKEVNSFFDFAIDEEIKGSFCLAQKAYTEVLSEIEKVIITFYIDYYNFQLPDRNYFKKYVLKRNICFAASTIQH